MQVVTQAATVTGLLAICTGLSCVQSIVMYITFELPHTSRRELGRYCSHFEDEEAEVTGAGS